MPSRSTDEYTRRRPDGSRRNNESDRRRRSAGCEPDDCSVAKPTGTDPPVDMSDRIKYAPDRPVFNIHRYRFSFDKYCTRMWSGNYRPIRVAGSICDYLSLANFIDSLSACVPSSRQDVRSTIRVFSCYVVRIYSTMDLIQRYNVSHTQLRARARMHELVDEVEHVIDALEQGMDSRIPPQCANSSLVRMDMSQKVLFAATMFPPENCTELLNPIAGRVDALMRELNHHYPEVMCY